MTVDAPRDDADDELDASDEALNWDGERDASHVAGPVPVTPRPTSSKSAKSRPGKPDTAGAEAASTGSATDATDATDAPAPTSSFLLVTYGIIAGAFLLYTIGWFTTVRRSTYIDPSVLGAFMSTLGEVLAVLAAPVWFGSVLLLTRTSKPIVRLLWLLLGLVLLVPIPFVLGV